MQPFAIYHEHPDWFKPLFEELNNRGISYIRLNPAAHQFAVDRISTAFRQAGFAIDDNRVGGR